MASPGTPAELRSYIIERLIGATGEPDRILAPARALAERTLPVLAKGLAAQFACAIPMELDGVDLTRFAEATGRGGDACAMSIASSPSSPDALLVFADSAAAALLVSVLFGGDPDEAVAPLDRPLSPTEVEVLALVFEEVARAINGSGERAFSLELPLPRPIVGSELEKMRLRDGPAVRISYALGAGVTRGRITVMMPQRVLLQHRSQATAGHGEAQDAWRERFGEGVMRSSISIEATMPVAKMTLAAISQLSEGQVIPIAGTGRSDVRLSARNRTLFVGELGKLGDNYTVRIRSPFDERQDLIDGLMTA